MRDGMPATAVRIRVRAEPINRLFLAGGAFAGIAYATWPASWSWWEPPSLTAGIASFAGAGFLARAAERLVKDYRLRRDLARSLEVSEDHGSAREATPEEIDARGMYDPASGDLLGLDRDGRPVFAPRQTPFGLYEMPPGVGKTACHVIPSIQHRLMTGASLVIPDPKLDLAPMLIPHIRALGIEVWAVNPTGQFIEICGDYPINPYQTVIDALYSDGDIRKSAIKYAVAFAELHYPALKDEKNPYFANGSRRSIVVAIIYLAISHPGRCTPTEVYALLADPGAFLKALRKIASALETYVEDDPVVAFMKVEAKSLLHRAAKNEENFASFLEGATQRLLSFNQAGHLNSYGASAIHGIAELRKRQIVLFIMAPLSHGRALAEYTSLLNHSIIEACKAEPGGHPVHIVGEEALSYQFHDMVSDLETVRQLKVTGTFYIQSFAGLEKRYGRDSAQAIESYCDVRVYAGLNSLQRAKHVSEMLSEETIRKQDYSYRREANDLNVSSRELGRRLMQPNEVLAMPRDQAWVFVRGMNPMKLTMIHYGQVSPWRDRVDPSPITGMRLRGEPLFTIEYDRPIEKED